MTAALAKRLRLSRPRSGGIGNTASRSLRLMVDSEHLRTSASSRSVITSGRASRRAWASCIMDEAYRLRANPLPSCWPKQERASTKAQKRAAETRTTRKPRTTESGQQPNPGNNRIRTTRKPRTTESGQQPNPGNNRIRATTESGQQPNPGNNRIREPNPGNNRIRATTESGQQPNPGNNRIRATTESGQQPNPGNNRIRATTESGQQPNPGNNRIRATTESGQQPNPGNNRIRATTESGQQPNPGNPGNNRIRATTPGRKTPWTTEGATDGTSPRKKGEPPENGNYMQGTALEGRRKDTVNGYTR